MQKDHQKIRDRAYEIWDQEGRQDGRADEHWSQAEREVGEPKADAPAAPKAAGTRAKAPKQGNGAAIAASAKTAATAPRKRRGAQSIGQG